MDSIFGDATTTAGTPANVGTPALYAEADSLVRRGSPVPSLDIRGRPRFGASAAVPGLDIDPPDVIRGAGTSSRSLPSQNDGLGGWFSRMIGRGKTTNGSNRGSGYAPIGQGED
jgi:hypothetical protein